MGLNNRTIPWITLLVGIAIGAVGMFLFMRSSPPARETEMMTFTPEERAAAQVRADMARSQSHMRGLVMGLIAYADDHDGRFPPAEDWSRLLLEGDYIIADALSSPVGGPDAYTLVAMPRDMDSSLLVFYEDPNHFESGVNVVYADTTVGHLSHDEFERLFSEQTTNESP